MPFTSPLSVTVGHLRIRFHGEGHRSIADRRLHMFKICTFGNFDVYHVTSGRSSVKRRQNSNANCDSHENTT